MKGAANRVALNRSAPNRGRSAYGATWPLARGSIKVGAFHDENANDHLDTNVLGLPTEGYALSNGVRPVMSKPTFQQAAFTVSNGDKPVALHIRY